MDTTSNKADLDSGKDTGRVDDVQRDRAKSTNPDANPDPITGAPGSHPLGTAAGATVGGLGAAAAGAAIGTAVAPGIGTTVGAVIGVVVGAAGGGVAGHDIAEGVNPSVEDAYWRENYQTRPYASAGHAYDEWAPAYRYGWESRTRHGDQTFEDVEDDLGSGWDTAKSNSSLDWTQAKPATRDAWERIDRSAWSEVRDSDSTDSGSNPDVSASNPGVSGGSDTIKKAGDKLRDVGR
jgi:hypothetical protein